VDLDKDKGHSAKMADTQGASLVIRSATPQDEPDLLAMAGRLAAFELPPWRRADEIAAADGHAMVQSVREGRLDDNVFLAERNGAAVGCLHVLATTDFFGRRHAHVSVLATSETAEGSGVGRALMAYAETWSRQRGLTLLTLNVFSANRRAIRFYERGGFAPEIVKYAKLL
jgi:ribosomal protein S18 acetylase RimI-like enzyme